MDVKPISTIFYKRILIMKFKHFCFNYFLFKTYKRMLVEEELIELHSYHYDVSRYEELHTNRFCQNCKYSSSYNTPNKIELIENMHCKLPVLYISDENLNVHPYSKCVDNRKDNKKCGIEGKYFDTELDKHLHTKKEVDKIIDKLEAKFNIDINHIKFSLMLYACAGTKSYSEYIDDNYKPFNCKKI